MNILERGLCGERSMGLNEAWENGFCPNCLIGIEHDYDNFGEKLGFCSNNCLKKYSELLTDSGAKNYPELEHLRNEFLRKKEYRVVEVGSNELPSI